ncbi:MAG: DPP IV N-terminal domain-containing protein, partial [Bacteroidales bacterium]|nr:DPP IV N-terminal domain-containing protein [Bacteroidales bacterium]
MKKFFLTVIFLFAVTLSWAQQTPVTSANYELAARFSPKKLNTLVFSTQIRPNWFKDSDKFWYEWRSPEGTFYYIVDPATGKKTPLFDNAEMAAELTEIVKDPFDAQNLPIKSLRLRDDNTFTFLVLSTAMVEKVDKKDSLAKKERLTKNDTLSINDTLAKKDSVINKPKKVTKERKIHYFDYDIRTNKLIEIEEDEPSKLYPTWGNVAPNKKHVIFSRDFNLWYMDIEDYEKASIDLKDTTIKENQLTTEGTAEFGFGFGNSDFYATKKEKNERKSAHIAWSPDSKKFILIRTNTKKVKDLWVINSLANPRPKLERYKYHMPGESGAPVRHLYIYDIESKEMKEIDVSAFKDQQLIFLNKETTKETMYDSIKHSVWQGDLSEFYVIRTSRDHKRVDLCVVDIANDTVKPIIEERMNTYIEIRRPKFVGDNIIWWSERSGWAHLYLYDTKGNLVNQITSGEFHVEDVAAVDEDQKIIYFTANAR